MTSIAATSPPLSLADPAAAKVGAGAGDGFAPVLASLLAGGPFQTSPDTLPTPGNDLPATGKPLPASEPSIIADQPPSSDAQITADVPGLSPSQPLAGGIARSGDTPTAPGSSTGLTPASPAPPPTTGDEAPGTAPSIGQRPTRFAPTRPTPLQPGAPAIRTRTPAGEIGDPSLDAGDTPLGSRDTSLGLRVVTAPAAGDASPASVDTSLPRQPSLPRVGSLNPHDTRPEPGETSPRSRDTGVHPRGPNAPEHQCGTPDPAPGADPIDAPASVPFPLDGAQVDPLTVTLPAIAITSVIQPARVAAIASPVPATLARAPAATLGPVAPARTPPAPPSVTRPAGPHADVEPAQAITAPTAPIARDVPLLPETTTPFRDAVPHPRKPEATEGQRVSPGAAPGADASLPAARLAPTPVQATNPIETGLKAAAIPLVAAPVAQVAVRQTATFAPHNPATPPAPDTSAVAPNVPDLDRRPAGQPLAQPQTGTPAPPAIQPAFQAFGAALHRAATAERRAAPLPEAQLLAAIGAPAPLAAAADPAPIDATRPDWPQTMVARIEQLRDQQSAPGSIGDTRIRLHPDALGTVDVTLRRDGDGTHVQLHAAEPATRTMLADAQPRLQALAESRGLRLAGSEVAGGSAQGGSGSWTGNDRRPPAPAPLTPQPRAPEAASDEPTDTRLA